MVSSAASTAAVEEDALGPVPQDHPKDEPKTTVEADESATATVEEQERRERRYMRLPRGLYQEFKQSKLSRDEFLDQKRYRANKFFVELAPGLVFGGHPATVHCRRAGHWKVSGPVLRARPPYPVPRSRWWQDWGMRRHGGWIRAFNSVSSSRERTSSLALNNTRLLGTSSRDITAQRTAISRPSSPRLR